MKYALIAFLVVFSPVGVSAQINNLFADQGICGSRLNPGLSATYTYKPVKFLGMGVGVQAYDFFPSVADHHQYVPAIYGDLRLTAWPRKKNQFFTFLDIGVDFYKRSDDKKQYDDVVYNDPRSHGTYTGWGIGYFHRKTEHGGGIYVSLKTISNTYKAHAYNVVTKEEYDEGSSRGSIVASVGFRFADHHDIYDINKPARKQTKDDDDHKKKARTSANIEAKKYNLYADAGIPATISATYNYNLTKNFSAGIGFQASKYHATYAETARLIPALFADLRITAWATKKNRFFTFLDLGIDMYKRKVIYERDSVVVYHYPHNNGFYTGLGLGYFHSITKRGSGLYLSLKMALNVHTVREYSYISDDLDRKLLAADGTPVLSIGFKF